MSLSLITSALCFCYLNRTIPLITGIVKTPDLWSREADELEVPGSGMNIIHWVVLLKKEG